MNEASLKCALDAIDSANCADPNLEVLAGESITREFAYSLHMTRWLYELDPAPSERLQIACRAQHIERWKMPRSDYPEGRKSYYEWRQACGRMHGRRAAEIMAECGYPDSECERVEVILTKRELRKDADTQLLEDVACMVFLEKYFAQFYADNAEYDREKWLRIVRRTWGKMSTRAHEQALALSSQLPEHLQALMQEALADSD
ncbi:MAG: DUF4202 domain-containing protein [Marinobacter sp.]|uniref:DUF4202 domain-containing protein n=1 Tax=Marinobacter sp. TaxID=50741 RepID=UPI003F9921A3